MNLIHPISASDISAAAPALPPELAAKYIDFCGTASFARVYLRLRDAERFLRVGRLFDPWPEAERLFREDDAVRLLKRIDLEFSDLLGEPAFRLFTGDEPLGTVVPGTAFAAHRLRVERRSLTVVGFEPAIPALIRRYVEAEAAALRFLSGCGSEDVRPEVFVLGLHRAGLPARIRVSVSR